MKNYKVTIAIPTYKPDYLALAIKSALSQTYTNIEVIVVDDNSPYDIEVVVKSFSDERLFYYKNKNNLGAKDPGHNWNRCVELATGDYFCLLCDDDLYAPTFVEELLALSVKYPECKVFRNGVNIIDNNNIITGYYASSPEYETVPDYMWHVFSGLRRQSISEFMHITKHIKQLKYFNAPLAWDTDYVSIYKLAWIGGIASSSKRLTSFRFSDSNISSNANDFIPKLAAKCLCLDEVRKMLDNCEIPNKNVLLKKYEYHKCSSQMWHVQYASWSTVFRFLYCPGKYSLSYSTVIKGIIKKIQSI